MVAAGYEVFAINPMSVTRSRERHSSSAAKSDAGDAHVSAEIMRLDRGHHRSVVGDTELGEAITLVARAHQSVVWDRTRHVLRLRSVLREFFPAAVEAFGDLDARNSLEVHAIAPDPDRAARLGYLMVGGQSARRPRGARGSIASYRPSAYARSAVWTTWDTVRCSASARRIAAAHVALSTRM